MFKFYSRAVCKNLQVLFALPKLILNSIFRLPFFKRKESKTILVLCVAHLGDVICLLPALHLLRKNYPKSKISVLTPLVLVDFFKRSPAHITPIPYNEKNVWLNFKLLLSHVSFDKAFVFWDKRELLLAQSIGCKTVISYSKFAIKYYKYLGTNFLKKGDELNVEKNFLELVHFDCESNKVNSVRFNVEDYFGKQKISRNNNVFLHSGCQSSCKMLPPCYWNRIAELVFKLGFNPIFTGSGIKEKNFVQQCDPCGKYRHAIDFFGIDDYAKELTLAKLLITVDTGIMHLAKYTGTKILTLCGGSSPLRIGPSEYFLHNSLANKTLNNNTLLTVMGGGILLCRTDL